VNVFRRHAVLLTLLIPAVPLLLVLWLVEQRWLDAAPRACRPLPAATYLTSADVSGASAEVVDQFLVSAKKRGEPIRASDVAAVPTLPGRAILALSLAYERSLGEMLTRDACVDVWAREPAGTLAQGLSVLKISAAEPGAVRLVYLAAEPSAVGVVLVAKEPALSLCSPALVPGAKP